MSPTAQTSEESPTCRVRHFSPDPNDAGKLVAGARIKTIHRSSLPDLQPRGFAEVDADGNMVGSIPTAEGTASASSKTVATGGKG